VPTDPPSARVLQRRREIGDRIRAAMLHANLTQERLAEATGLSRDTIVRVELGTADARLSWLIAIADACGLELAELVR
jgi:transcriptional regulator with XRE-family HTH domain